MDRVKKYVGALEGVFRTAPDKHEANRRSRAVLEDMSGDRGFLADALAAHLRAPGSLSRQHYPGAGFNVDLNPQFGLAGHCRIPLPGRESDISAQAIRQLGRFTELLG